MSATLRNMRGAAAILAIMALAQPADAEGRPGFAVSRYEPSERGSDWFVVDGLDLRGNGRPALGATLDHAYKPLVVYDAAENERLALVRHQLFAHLGASFVLAERLRLAVNLPVAVVQDGDAAIVGGEPLKAATAPAFGDLRLAADVRIVGRHGDPFTLAAGVRGWLPTGMSSQFTSDGAVRLAPQVLLAGAVGVFSWAARTALVHRSRDDGYAGIPLGPELDLAFGAGLRLGRFTFGPELFAATGLDDDTFLSTHRSPADAVLGVHYALPSGLRFGAAFGSGLTRGFGSPAFRALRSAEWGSPLPVGPSDHDHDGIADAADACPDTPGVPSGDPEINGCPEPERVPDEDTDGDGVWDRDDACPVLAGVRTTDPMTNGCPAGAPPRLAVVTKTEIRIGQQVRFTTDSADLVTESDVVLEAVKRVLEEHPDILRVRVEGHTDAVGDVAYNEDLSKRRAMSVATWLTDHGIAPGRLEAQGFGSQRPLETNDTEEGRATNRRVVFTIVERKAPKRP